jgi:bacteriocin biosynthesis cyclodehydratase domain-containing protein
MSHLQDSVAPEELAKMEHVPLEEVQTLIDHLLDLGVAESSPSSALDFYLDNLVPWRTEAPRPPLRVALLGDVSLTSEIRRFLGDSLPAGDITTVPLDDPGRTLLSDPDTSWLHDGLQFENRLQAFDSWRGSFIVVATKVMNPVQLRTWNRVGLAHRIPWLHAAVDGPFLLIGPTVVPHRSPCFECLEMRVTMNLRENASYQSYKSALVDRQVRSGDLPLEPALAGMIASHAALETINFCLTGTSFTVGKLLAIHLPTMEFAFNEILRVPTCPACGPVAGRDDTELYFDSAALISAKQSAEG